MKRITAYILFDPTGLDEDEVFGEAAAVLLEEMEKSVAGAENSALITLGDEDEETYRDNSPERLRDLKLALQSSMRDLYEVRRLLNRALSKLPHPDGEALRLAQSGIENHTRLLAELSRNRVKKEVK